MEQKSNQTVLVGMDVPDLTIETYEPATGVFGRVSLNEFRPQGLWTVLVFYPADFTFVCATELADIAAHLDEIQALRVKVISISADTEFAHIAWCNSEKMLQKVRFTMGADPAGAASKLFGVNDEFSRLVRRGTIEMNPQGSSSPSRSVTTTSAATLRNSCAGSRPSLTLRSPPTRRALRSGSPASRPSSHPRRWPAVSSRRCPSSSPTQTQHEQIPD
jgi:alkyl hydroperoxide reductase subunit AhpC